MNQQYLSTKQTAQLLGLSESTVKRLRKRPNVSNVSAYGTEFGLG